jgi:hypothetical protein
MVRALRRAAVFTAVINLTSLFIPMSVLINTLAAGAAARACPAPSMSGRTSFGHAWKP